MGSSYGLLTLVCLAHTCMLQNVRMNVKKSGSYLMFWTMLKSSPYRAENAITIPMMHRRGRNWGKCRVRSPSAILLRTNRNVAKWTLLVFLFDFCWVRIPKMDYAIRHATVGFLRQIPKRQDLDAFKILNERSPWTERSIHWLKDYKRIYQWVYLIPKQTIRYILQTREVIQLQLLAEAQKQPKKKERTKYDRYLPK